jgi:hypothetical protein
MKYKIISFIFIIFIFIPYFKFLPFPSELQPNAFLIGLLLLIIMNKIYFSKLFYLLIIPMIFSILLLSMNDFTIVHIKEVYGYTSFFLLSVISYNYFIFYGEIKYKFYRNILFIYMLVGLIQLYIQPNFFHIFLARELGYNGFQGRGVESMTTEPTYYGLILLFIFILVYNSLVLSNNQKNRLYLLITISLLLVSKSTTAIVGFFIFLLFDFIKINIKLLIKFLFFLIASIFIFHYYYQDIITLRVFKLFEFLLTGGIVELINKDQSSNDRILHVVFSIKGFFDSFGLPHGFSAWNDYIQLQSSLGYDTKYISSEANKILSFIGTLLFELGVFSFPIFIYIFLVLKRRFKIRFLLTFSILFIYILFQALTISYTFIPFILSFFLYQSKIIKKRINQNV